MSRKFIFLILPLLVLASCIPTSWNGFLTISESLTLKHRTVDENQQEQFHWVTLEKGEYKSHIEYTTADETFELTITKDDQDHYHATFPFPEGLDMETGGEFELTKEQTDQLWSLEGELSISSYIESEIYKEEACTTNGNMGNRSFTERTTITEYDYEMLFVDPDNADILAIFEGIRQSSKDVEKLDVSDCIPIPTEPDPEPINDDEEEDIEEDEEEEETPSEPSEPTPPRTSQPYPYPPYYGPYYPYPPVYPYPPYYPGPGRYPYPYRR